MIHCHLTDHVLQTFIIRSDKPFADACVGVMNNGDIPKRSKNSFFSSPQNVLALSLDIVVGRLV